MNKKTKVVLAYKGFDKNMRCRGFQYEFGKEYIHDGPVKACDSGFHACENPLDVLNYYDLIDSKFCTVELSGELSRHGEDSKIASGKITVKAELSLPQFIGSAVVFLMGLVKDGEGYKVQSASGYYSKLAASGDSSKLAASGNYSQLAASGESSIAVASATNCTAKAGELGCIALTRWVESEKRYRVSVAYVGENGIKADTWYGLDSNGKFVEVE